MTAPTTFALPLAPVAHDESGADWEGFSPAEPLDAQGDYRPAGPLAPLELPDVQAAPVLGAPELLAPAGNADAAHAAFHFGADAVFLGLKKFSARAEADNFSLEEVDALTAYAHSLTPRRRVFVTLNTLVRQDELAELVEAVAALSDIGVDALIVQDLGVYRLVREHFPTLELHASTQLAVHNRAGAEVLKALGFPRVVLARELTFEEVRDITATAGVETEVFVHGALCYSYSGLCLFSSQTTGRSGNRGKCNYSCRDTFTSDDAPQTLRDDSPVRRDPSQGFPFSMKDLALPDHVPALRAAGVSCFKIEGRKKSPLYVATTTDYYRRLLDGTLDAGERPDIEAELQSVFSRPWTRLFIQSHKDKEVADRDTVGHRGTAIGQVEHVSRGYLRFTTRRAIQTHDGVQIDVPGQGRPFGFAVEGVTVIGPGNRRREVYECAPGDTVELRLPPESPILPVGAAVYCSSSQAVKQKYRHESPNPEAFRVRTPVDFALTLSADALTATATVSDPPVSVTRSLPGPFAAASDPAATLGAADSAFAKLGQTRHERRSFTLSNPDARFVPVSRLNALRRDLCAALDEAIDAARAQRTARVLADVAPPATPKSLGPTEARWSLLVDRTNMLDALEDADLAGLDEVVIDIARDHPATLPAKLDALAARVGRGRVRLALPAITRAWEDKAVRAKVAKLRGLGWDRWQIANVSGWSYLGLDVNAPLPAGFDLSADWSVYAINRLAARELLSRGLSRFTLSPEDGVRNVRSLLSEFPRQAVWVVHQDTPMFVAESCAYANLIGGCPGKANCRFESMTMTSSHGERVTALDYHCRTIVLNDGPFCVAGKLAGLKLGPVNVRADFVYRKYDPETVRDRLRLLRGGRDVPGGHAANLERGLL